jgi:hypothetical protein
MTSRQVVDSPVLSTPGDETYRKALAQLIRERIGQGASSVAELAAVSAGAYPTDIEQALESLIANKEVVFDGGVLAMAGEPHQAPRRLRKQKRPQPTVRLPALPSPHPADFDWRFTERTANLLGRAVRKWAKHGRIAVFGAPTVYSVLRQLGADVVLYERNRGTIHALAATDRAIAADLSQALPASERQYALVVADPPWYVEHFCWFAYNATRVLTDGGLLLLSLPQRMTRPGAERDVATVEEYAKDLGLDRCFSLEGVLEYSTPPFEQAALAAAGLRCGDWRRGNLDGFRLSLRSRVGGPPAQTAVEGPWQSFLIGDRQIRVRSRRDGNDQFFWVNALGPGAGTLDTVSRRSPLRQRIDVWSDLNQAWEVSSPGIVGAVLDRVTMDQDPAAAVAAESAARGLDASSRAALEALIGALVRRG